MLKLKSLITEQEFKAKSKETGRTVVYKSKDSMDKAIKGGKAEPLDKKTGGKPEKVKGASLFKKDKPKSEPKKVPDRSGPGGDQKTKDTLIKGLKTGLNPYQHSGLVIQVLDFVGDYPELTDRIEKLDPPTSIGKSDAQYQKELDAFRKEENELRDDIIKALSDKPKSKKMPSSIAFTPDGKKVFGAEISTVDDLKNSIKGIEGRVDLQIFDANISDEFNDSLYIQDGKLMFTDVFGDEEEITDEETLEALKDVIEDEGGLEVQKTKFEKGDKIKSKTSFHFAKDVKKIKGSYDLGGVTIKDGKMFNADGEEMDEDDIEDFYYQQATDEQGNEVGVEVFKKLEEQLKKSISLLSEAQVWERKFGEPLPTFSSVMEKHSGKKDEPEEPYDLSDFDPREDIDEQGALSKRAGINVFGDRKLQLMAKGLRQSAFDLEKVAKRKDEQAFDDILQRITITIGVIRSFLNKPKRSM